MSDTLIESRVDAPVPGRAAPKVLVVEDDPAIADVLRLNLQARGYLVVTASDGVAALQVFEREGPDLVTLDLNVPKVSGYRLIQLFKKFGPPRQVPVIVITALDYEEAQEVIEAGADDFVSKPFEREELLQKVDFALTGKWQAVQ
jgi:DNA-binding response OmpR family regulator